MDENQLNENIMLINLPSAFDFKANLGYLMREKNECMFHIEGDTITRVIAVGDIRSLVQISANDQNQLAVHFLKGTRPEEERHRDLIKAYMKEWFDLDSDLTPFYEMAKNDPLLKKPIEDFYGLRHVGIPDLFEALCWGVIGQQINLTYAYTLKRRFVEKFGEAMERDSKTYWMFPTFDKIAKLTTEDFADMKMTVKKSEYIIGIARLMADGELSKDLLMNMKDFKRAEKSLIKIRGIGPWTANYVLMRCLRFPNAFPIDDIGLINSIKTLAGMDRKPTKEEITKYAAPWRNWESYATFYLWRVLY
ncbi:DNA-3-methyladenine glycosylase family protein [Bacillus nakamurai]|uniref:DNA-3-methyladenine glycosylase family protein n=1 Tax=Bacillus nakamurai TaxID=1793963 RepID=UPI0020C2F6B2|nr:DNA-3-methyladenine glycosylase [Bacillus nakamurai]MCP6682286.1 DNA-3-methyladenine glycosylase [Bacillus nakamurai]